MLDFPQRGSGSDKPTWDDIETLIKSHIDHYLKVCSYAVKHTTCFVGGGSKIMEIIALAGNSILQRVITDIIAELIATDPHDICFKQFIKRLKLRLKNYELMNTS